MSTSTYNSFRAPLNYTFERPSPEHFPQSSRQTSASNTEDERDAHLKLVWVMIQFDKLRATNC